MTDSPGHELALRPSQALSVMSDGEINRSWRIAEALAKSGIFPDAKTAGQAFAKMLVGYDLGMSPTQALMGVHIVKGKPQIASTVLAGFVRQHPTIDYRVVVHTTSRCVIEFGPAPAPPRDRLWRNSFGRSTFTIKDAKDALLGGWPDAVKWGESGWGRNPRNMVFARAMSNGVKWYCPDVMGGVPIYTEADEFTIRPALTAGVGSGEAERVELPHAVEKVLRRAEELGHVGLADRAAAEMATAGRAPEVAALWAVDAHAELDALQRRQADGEGRIEEANIVEPTPAQLRSTADQLDRDAGDADAEGKTDEAAGLRAQAAQMREEADAREDVEARS